MFFVAVLAGAIPPCGTLVFGCTPSTSEVGAGGECFVATDCAPGLVCVAQRGGARQCTNDLSQVTGRPPPEAGEPAEAAGDAPDDGTPTPDSGGEDTSMPDTSMPDTSKPDAAEAG